MGYLIRCVIAFAIAISITGCASVEIFSSDKTAQPGIPFFVKMPILKQETQYSKSSTEVSVTVYSAKADGSKDKELFTLHRQIEGVVNAGQVESAMIQKFTAHAPKSSSEAQSLTSAVLESISGSNPGERLTKNNVEMTYIVNPNHFYIRTNQPIIGSATSNLEFQSDGTLGKASQTITDDTAKTLLSLFPISSKLQVQWGISKGAAFVPEGGAVEIEKPILIINVAAEEVITVTTLSKFIDVPREGATAESFLAPRVALKKDCATSEARCAHVASVVVITPAAAAAAAKTAAANSDSAAKK